MGRTPHAAADTRRSKLGIEVRHSPPWRTCPVTLLWNHHRHKPNEGGEDETMGDHIFNEARSREILQDLRAEATRMQLVLTSRPPSHGAWLSRASLIASLVALALVATIASGLQMAT
jgi:hypothetical protein